MYVSSGLVTKTNEHAKKPKKELQYKVQSLQTDKMQEKSSWELKLFTCIPWPRYFKFSIFPLAHELSIIDHSCSGFIWDYEFKESDLSSWDLKKDY